MEWISSRKKKKPKSRTGWYTIVPVIIKDINGESGAYGFYNLEKKQWYNIMQKKIQVVAWFDIDAVFDLYFKRSIL